MSSVIQKKQNLPSMVRNVSNAKKAVSKTLEEILVKKHKKAVCYKPKDCAYNGIIYNNPYCNHLHEDDQYEYHHDKILPKNHTQHSYTIRMEVKNSRLDETQNIKVQNFTQYIQDQNNPSNYVKQQSSRVVQPDYDLYLNQNQEWYNSGQYQSYPYVPPQPWTNYQFQPLINPSLQDNFYTPYKNHTKNNYSCQTGSTHW